MGELFDAIKDHYSRGDSASSTADRDARVLAWLQRYSNKVFAKRREVEGYQPARVTSYDIEVSQSLQPSIIKAAQNPMFSGKYIITEGDRQSNGAMVYHISLRTV